jgi:hypothetical protein
MLLGRALGFDELPILQMTAFGSYRSTLERLTLGREADAQVD